MAAGVCELMLLTLGNEQQTWTIEGGRGERIKEVVSRGEGTAVPGNKTQGKQGLDVGGLCNYLTTAAIWKM